MDNTFNLLPNHPFLSLPSSSLYQQTDGRIRFNDFEAALEPPPTSMDGSDDNDQLEDDDEESTAVTPSFEQVIIQPKPIPELYVNKDKERIEKKVEIKLEALKEIQVKIKDVNSWKMIWMSEGTGARKEVSIWGMKPVTRTLIKRNKHRVMLGQYAAIGFGSRSSAKPPKSLKGYTMELTDLHISTVSRSSNLDESHVNYLMPYPVAFKMVWWHQSGTIIYPSLSLPLSIYPSQSNT